MVDTWAGDAKPPKELRLSWLVTKYGTLPESGGLLDQEYALIHRMDVASNIHSTLQRLSSLTGHSIHKLTDTERRTLRLLKDLDLL